MAPKRADADRMAHAAISALRRRRLSSFPTFHHKESSAICRLSGWMHALIAKLGCEISAPQVWIPKAKPMA
ncbi:MAG TPA: hypothetical protein VN924_05230, partial [Bryobacteraceae bacterium]|nr:hypothetical protein [Bryobacteraceae bacterium]